MPSILQCKLPDGQQSVAVWRSTSQHTTKRVICFILTLPSPVRRCGDSTVMLDANVEAGCFARAMGMDLVKHVELAGQGSSRECSRREVPVVV